MKKKELNINEFWEDYLSQARNNIISTIQFKNYFFIDPIQLKPSKKIEFINCDFNGETILKTVTEDITFNDCKFLSSLGLQNTKFEKNARFFSCTFNHVEFNNTSFKKLADFWSCTFNEKVIFYKTDFLGTTVFSAATFNKAALFTYSLIEKTAIFRGTKFNGGLDLSQAIISGNLSLHDLKIKPFNAVDDVDDNDTYEALITDEGKIPYINKRETFRILKQTFSKNGNEIDSLEYRKKEHLALYEETRRNIIRRRKFLTSLENSIILTLNWSSNLFGVSWFAGLLFIVTFGGLFYLLSITSLSSHIFTISPSEWQLSEAKYFFEFLNPTHKIDYIQEGNLNGNFYAFDFIGRIFVGYGIYQFIQAFRKYK